MPSSKDSNRREFLKTLITGAAGISLSYQAFGRPQSAAITANKLTGNVAVITGAGGNVTVLTGTDGLLMVNGGLPERCADLMKVLSDQFKGQRVQVLFSTGGWIGGMLDATKALVNLANAETRVVPGRGPVQTRADLEAQQEMLTTMKDRLIKLMRSGMGPDDWIAAAPTKDFDARWGNP